MERKWEFFKGNNKMIGMGKWVAFSHVTFSSEFCSIVLKNCFAGPNFFGASILIFKTLTKLLLLLRKGQVKQRDKTWFLETFSWNHCLCVAEVIFLIIKTMEFSSNDNNNKEVHVNDFDSNRDTDPWFLNHSSSLINRTLIIILRGHQGLTYYFSQRLKYGFSCIILS